MTDHQALRAFEAVMPLGTTVTSSGEDDRDALVLVAGQRLRVRWLPVGWPRQVKEALRQHPRPDVLAAPQLSPGARSIAEREHVGWVDATGAASISSGTLVVSRSGQPPVPVASNLGWRPATLAICEVLLTGCSPTVSAGTKATGLAMSTVAESLRFLQGEALLGADSARGREAGRRVTDRDALLDAYAAAAAHLRSRLSIRVGVLWRDPLTSVAATGLLWRRAGFDWAVTSALSAAVLAPMLAEPTPMEVYVRGRTPADLRRAALAASLNEMDGGRLLLRPFPTPAAAKVTTTNAQVRSVLWPRAYADLRTTGVRGEEAAEHLRREEMQRAVA